MLYSSCGGEAFSTTDGVLHHPRASEIKSMWLPGSRSSTRDTRVQFSVLKHPLSFKDLLDARPIRVRRGPEEDVRCDEGHCGGLPCELRPRQVHNIDLLRFCWTLPQGLQCTKTSVIASRYIYEWPLNVAKLELAGLPLLVLVTRLHEHCDEQSPGAQAGALLVVVT